jgi:hypothetical protein
MLGLGPCYHWVDLIADLDRVEQWSAELDGAGHWDEIFAGYNASVDWPGGFFYRELADTYPEAKVLLSVRDPEQWEKSFRETIWDMCFGDSLMCLLSRARAKVDPRWQRYLALVDRMFWIDRGTFAGGHAEPRELIEAMVAHTEAVRASFPPERLLIWQPGDGWEPLCRFLDVEVPDAPLPHVNDRETFIDRVIGGALDALQAARAPATATDAS